jgi:mono/diheme cytochrome c family protein
LAKAPEEQIAVRLHLSLAALVFTVVGNLPIAAADGFTPAWTTATVEAKSGQSKGYLQFQNYCSVCHGGGPEKPGTRALRSKYGTQVPAMLEERTDLAPQYVKLIVRQGISVMPQFRKTELSDSDLEAIAAYLTQKKPRK